MKRFAVKYGLPVAIAAAVIGYYVWPVTPVWTVFEVAEEPGAANNWLADGFLVQEECDDYIRILYALPRVPDGTRLVCGYDCRFLRSAPSFAGCTSMGEVHDKS